MSDVLKCLNLSKEKVYQYAQQINRMGSWVYWCDTEQGWWSDEVFEIYGRPQTAEFSKELFLSRIHPEDYKTFMETWQKALEGTPFQIVHRIDVNGEILWLEEKGEPVDDFVTGQKFIVGTVQDITGTKKQQEYRQSKQLEFQTIVCGISNQKEIEENSNHLQSSFSMDKLKLEFISGLTHEFKTPVHMILSSLQILTLKMSMEDQEHYINYYKKFCDYIEHNAYKILRLTTNLLNSTKIENGFLELNFEVCDFKLLIEECVNSADIYAAAKGIKINILSYIKAGQNIYCDRDKIDCIMLNLLSNAIKYTNNGGKVDVILTENEQNLVVEVSDNGSGISKELLPHIFEKYRTAKSRLIKNCDGGGLGLCITKALVELHGGKITVHSIEKEGSTFRFTLPKTYKNCAPRGGYIAKNSKNSTHRALVKMEMSDLKECN